MRPVWVISRSWSRLRREWQLNCNHWTRKSRRWRARWPRSLIRLTTSRRRLSRGGSEWLRRGTSSSSASRRLGRRYQIPHIIAQQSPIRARHQGEEVDDAWALYEYDGFGEEGIPVGVASTKHIIMSRLTAWKCTSPPNRRTWTTTPTNRSVWA